MPVALGNTLLTGIRLGTAEVAAGYLGTAEVWVAGEPPGAPTDLVAVGGDTLVTLTWTAPLVADPAVTDYQIEYRTRPGPALHSVNFASDANPMPAPWVARNGTNYMRQLGGVATYITTGVDSTYTYVDMASPDHWAQADLRADDGYSALCARIKLPFRNDAADCVIDPAHRFAMNKHVSGIETELDSAAGASAGVTYTVRIECLGNNLRMYVDGTVINEATSSAINDGLGVGIGSAANSGVCTIDNFSAGLMVGAWATYSDTVSAATGATATGLVNGLAHDFQVRAVNAAGAGPWSNTASATTSATLYPPGAPTGLTPVAGFNKVTLTWTAPTSDGGSAITDYVVQYGVTATPVVWSTVPGESTATTAVVAGLTNGTGYSFRVATQNAIGQSAYTSTVEATPGGGWSPASLSGLQGWWEAATPPTSRSGPEPWSPSGTTYPATAAMSRRPPPPTSRPGRHPERARHHRLRRRRQLARTTSFTQAQPLTFAFVIKTNPASGDQNVIITSLGGDLSVGQADLPMNVYAAGTPTNYDVDMRGTHSYIVVVNGASTTVYQNGGASDTGGDPGSVGTTTGLRMGAERNLAGDPAMYFGGQMCEALICSGSISSGDRTSLFAYFADKWGL